VENLLPFIIVAVVLVVAVIVFSRRRSETSDLGSPVRLGPSWSPPEDELADDPSAVALRERDLTVAKGGVDLDERAVTTTLEAWWEYLSVLRVRPLPRGHRYRFYDPYDPPVTELGPDGPVPDPVRVARDVAQRTSVAEIDAFAVLEAVLREGGPVASERTSEDDLLADVREDADDRGFGEELPPDDRDDPTLRGRGGDLEGRYDDVLDDPEDVIEDPEDMATGADDVPADPDDPAFDERSVRRDRPDRE
jgi:hypothetical protein